MVDSQSLKLLQIKDYVFMKLYFILLMKSHLQSYPCPLIINYFATAFLDITLLFSSYLYLIFLSVNPQEAHKLISTNVRKDD